MISKYWEELTLYLCVESGIRGWEGHINHTNPMPATKDKMLTTKQTVKNGLVYLVSQISSTDTLGDTYHRVTQWPFQCWPVDIRQRDVQVWTLVERQLSTRAELTVVAISADILIALEHARELCGPCQYPVI